jgi:hypothetical protein
MHVSAIKKTVVAVNPWQASFNLYYSTGQVDKATQLLMQSIMQESDFADAFYLNTSIRESAQKRLSDKYAPYLDLLGMKFDFDKANSFIAKF